MNSCDNNLHSLINERTLPFLFFLGRDFKTLIMKKYNIIYADPAWRYGSKSAVNNSTGSEIKKLEEHYDSMSTEDIKNMPVKNITADDCALFLWVTDSHLKEGIEVIESWGFKYKTIAFNWIKKTSKGNTCVNVAPWTLKSSEVCLFGTKGTMTKYKKNNSVMQLIEAERTRHSKKPNEARKRIIDLFGDIPRIELFAREKMEGFDVWGNELENDVTLMAAIADKERGQKKIKILA